MANRAYLFSSEHRGDWDNALSCEYFDSRHNIPLAWWFLFAPSDVVLVEQSYGEVSWKEMRFCALKQQAVARFQERKELLSQIVGSQPDPNLLQWFVNQLEM